MTPIELLAPALLQAEQGGLTALVVQLVPFLLIFVIFWFLLIAPARKRQKQHEQMLDDLKRGDRVITNGGIYGKVVSLDDGVAVVEIGDNTKIKITKSSIAGLQGEADPTGGTP